MAWPTADGNRPNRHCALLSTRPRAAYTSRRRDFPDRAIVSVASGTTIFSLTDRP